MYYLYSIKMGGWASLMSNYTSDLTQAKKFSEDEMLLRVKAQRTKTGLGLIPVSVTFVENLL
jgi:hypothetical protein